MDHWEEGSWQQHVYVHGCILSLTLCSPMHFIKFIQGRHAFSMILQMATTLCLAIASACLGGKLKDLSCQEQFRNVLLLFLSLLETFGSRKK